MASIDKATKKTLQAMASYYTYMSHLVNEMEAVGMEPEKYFVELMKVEGTLTDLMTVLEHYRKVLKTLTDNIE